MARMTITLSEGRQRALKETAASSGKTIGQLIEESLEAYGVKSRYEAEQLLGQARCRAELNESEALALATEETSNARHGA
jgi:16S rRNA U516 pseudouridylate synthase RsuA-like enzyme